MDLTGLEPLTFSMRSRPCGTLPQLPRDGASVHSETSRQYGTVRRTGVDAHLQINTTNCADGAPSAQLYGNGDESTMTDFTLDPLAADGRALPSSQPTKEDVRSFMEFLAERYPQMFETLERAAAFLEADGVDLSRLLENDNKSPSPNNGTDSAP